MFALRGGRFSAGDPEPLEPLPPEQTQRLSYPIVTLGWPLTFTAILIFIGLHFIYLPMDATVSFWFAVVTFLLAGVVAVGTALRAFTQIDLSQEGVRSHVVWRGRSQYSWGAVRWDEMTAFQLRAIISRRPHPPWFFYVLIHGPTGWVYTDKKLYRVDRLIDEAVRAVQRRGLQLDRETTALLGTFALSGRVGSGKDELDRDDEGVDDNDRPGDRRSDDDPDTRPPDDAPPR